MKEKQSSKVTQTIKITFNVLFYSVIVFLLVFSIANMKVKSEDNIANIFGIGILSVQSNSMYGDQADSFEQGDMLFVKMLDDEARANLKVGDVVTYFDMTIHEFNTHRIVEINTLEGYLVTQADYNYQMHDHNTAPDQPVNINDVISIYDGNKILGFGNSLDYVQSPTGFALLIILPVIILLVVEGIILARNIMSVNHTKLEEKYAIEQENARKLLEAEKEKMRAELLKEMQLQKQ